MKNFADLTHELGELLDVDIRPDLNQMCRLLIDRKIVIHLEIDVVGEFILIVAIISELPPGKFRENILRSALKANYQTDTHPGIFAYVGRENQLILFEHVYAHGLTAEQLYDRINILVQRAKKWKDAIDAGMPAPPDPDEVPGAKEGGKGRMFGF